MDFITCKICSVPYDEEDHRPRNPACGHELCSSCIRAIIRDGIFECPRCREKNQVHNPEDLQINFGLIGVVRAFNSHNITLPKESQPGSSGAMDDQLCKVHMKSIRHRCLNCQVWICDECIDSHSSRMGCSTISSTDAVRSIKEKHSTEIKDILTTFKDDSKSISSKIHEYTDKRKEYLKLAEKCGEELQKFKKLLEEGNFHKEKMEESQNLLKATDSPTIVTERNDVLVQWKQLLRSWSVKSKEVEFSIENQGLGLTVKSSRAEPADAVPKKMEIRKMHNLTIPGPTLVFFDVSYSGSAHGRLTIQLHNYLPNIKENMLNIANTKFGKSISGVTVSQSRTHLYAANLPFSGIPVSPDSIAKSVAKRGEVVGYYTLGYLNTLCFTVGAYDFTNYGGYTSAYVIGTILSGLDVLDACINNYRGDIKITACGIV